LDNPDKQIETITERTSKRTSKRLLASKTEKKFNRRYKRHGGTVNDENYDAVAENSRWKTAQGQG
jgi:hypothetical protein